MNDVVKTIVDRRSVRSYSQKPVDRDLLDTIISAGNAAPSGAGTRCWRFVAVQSADFLKKLAHLARPAYDAWLNTMPDQFKAMRLEIDIVKPDPVYYGAPVVVFVIGWGNTSGLDCPMVCENMMLAARSLGIGSCWVFIGSLITGHPDIKSALELKENEKVYGPILLGYPAEGFPPNPELKPPVVKYL